MKIKLSPAQLHVLVELKKGTVLHRMSGLSSYWFLSKEFNHLNPRTIWKLEKLGFVKRTDEFHQKGILTDKGRAYLDEISQTKWPKDPYHSPTRKDDWRKISVG